MSAPVGRHHHKHVAKFTPAQLKEIKAEVQKELKPQLSKLRDEFRSGTVSGSNATGGANLPAPSPDTTGPGVLNGNNDENLGNLFNNLGGLDSKMQGDLQQLGDASISQAKLIQLQTEIQNIQRVFDTVSNLLKSLHDTKMGVIGNMK